MKATLLLLLLTSATAFAQTKLIDEFPAMMKARNADVAGWFGTRTTPDMVFIAGHDGSIQNKDWLMGLFKNQKSHKVDISNLTIQQAGDLAVATGISTIEAVSLDGSKTNFYKDAFTYTLRWINGRWMFKNLHHTKIDYKQYRLTEGAHAELFMRGIENVFIEPGASPTDLFGNTQ